MMMLMLMLMVTMTMMFAYMSILRQLVQETLRELRLAYTGNKFPGKVTNHAGAEDIKTVVQDSQQLYIEYSNYPGALVMLMVLGRQDFQFAQKQEALPPMVDGQKVNDKTTIALGSPSCAVNLDARNSEEVDFMAMD